MHAGVPRSDGTVAVLGPGTGLGSCFGVWVRPPPREASLPRPPPQLHIFPSEGGESDFVASTCAEIGSRLGRGWVEMIRDVTCNLYHACNL